MFYLFLQQHCFCKNLYNACRDYQLLIASTLVCALCEVIFSCHGLFHIGLYLSDIEFLLYEIS